MVIKMFAAVIVTPAASNNPVKAIIRKLYGSVAELREFRTKTVRYFVIETHPDRDGGINWMQITGVAENAGIKSLLLPRSLQAPERCRGLICSSADYRRLYVYRISRLIARQSGIHPSKLRVGLIDLQGRQETDFAGKALSFCSAVKVITKNTSGYSFLEKWDSAAENQGPFISTEPDLSFLDDCPIIMAPFGVGGLRLPCAHHGITVSAEPVPAGYTGYCVDGFEPLLPPEIAAACPPDTDILEYASALWKYAGLSPLDRLPVKSLLHGGRPADRKEINKIIDSFGTL